MDMSCLITLWAQSPKCVRFSKTFVLFPLAASLYSLTASLFHNGLPLSSKVTFPCSFPLQQATTSSPCTTGTGLSRSYSTVSFCSLSGQHLCTLLVAFRGRPPPSVTATYMRLDAQCGWVCLYLAPGLCALICGQIFVLRLDKTEVCVKPRLLMWSTETKLKLENQVFVYCMAKRESV